MRISDWSSDVCSSDLHDGADGAAVGQHMAMIARQRGGVGRHGDAAGGHDGKVGDQPFRPVLRHQHHAVAGLQAQVAQAARDLADLARDLAPALRSEEHTSELQSLMRLSYAVFCLKKTKSYNEM